MKPSANLSLHQTPAQRRTDLLRVDGDTGAVREIFGDWASNNGAAGK